MIGFAQKYDQNAWEDGVDIRTVLDGAKTLTHTRPWETAQIKQLLLRFAKKYDCISGRYDWIS